MKAHRRRRGAALLATGLLALLACHRDVAAQSPAAGVQTPPEITIQPLPPGPVFADVDGYTLYVSERDAEAGKSACVGVCVAEWTPLRASAEAKAFGDWTLVPRPDGAAQWAYKGRPLYRYAKESKPRWADGQNQLWRYALVSPFPPRGAFGRQQGLGGAAPAGAAAAGAAQGVAGFANIRGARAPKVPLPPGVPAGITGQPSADGAVFADAKGFTLYTSTAAGTCAGPCLGAWRPFPAPLLAAEPAGDWTIVSRPDGTLQWAYKGKPLYRSSKDAKAGDTNGAGADWQVIRIPGA